MTPDILKSSEKGRLLSTAFFEVMIEGDFPLESINVSLVNGSLPRSEDTESFIEEKWQKWPGKKFPDDTVPSRYPLAGYEVEDGDLKIFLDPCISYRDFIGIQDGEFTRKFGFDRTPLAVVTETIVKTSDNKVLLLRRKPGHDYKPEGFSSIGGFMEIGKDFDESGNPNIKKAAAREIKEEIGLDIESETRSVSCLGIAFNPNSTAAVIILAADADKTSKEIISRPNDGENSIHAFNNDPDTIRDLIIYLPHIFVSSSLGVLLLYGKREYGDEWYKEMVNALELRGRGYKDPRVKKALEERDFGRLKRRIQRGNFPKT